MKNNSSILILLFSIVFLPFTSYSISCITPGPDTIKTNSVIKGSCIINGDLILLNGTTLNVDLTGAVADTFVVRGNILLLGSAVLWIHADSGKGAQFIVSNSVNNQRSITTKDSSRVQLEFIEFRTQEGSLSSAGNFYMNYYAQGKSILYVNNGWLNTQYAWLLCNMLNKSTLLAFQSNELPTETYIQDTAEVALHGSATKAGLWLNFESITSSLSLPANQALPYTWMIGRGSGGLSTLWYLEIDTANPGLGLQIQPNAKMTITGTGMPSTGELKVALLFSNSTDTVRNLKSGLQNKTVRNGPNGNVTLNNVNLGPIAWQLYALAHENLFIDNSTVNEIGIAGPSTVTVDSSILQLGLLAAVGFGGSTLTINNSQIWNQGITASNNSKVFLNDCSVTGSALGTTDGTSSIQVTGGCFLSNPMGCTPGNMVNISTGLPFCNPFVQSGLPKILTPSTINLIGVGNSCTTSLAPVFELNSKLLLFPNPNGGKFNMVLEGGGEMVGELNVFNSLGEKTISDWVSGSASYSIDLSAQSSGVYYLRFISDEGAVVQKLIIQK